MIPISCSPIVSEHARPSHTTIERARFYHAISTARESWSTHVCMCAHIVHACRALMQLVAADARAWPAWFSANLHHQAALSYNSFSYDNRDRQWNTEAVTSLQQPAGRRGRRGRCQRVGPLHHCHAPMPICGSSLHIENSALSVHRLRALQRYHFAARRIRRELFCVNDYCTWLRPAFLPYVVTWFQGVQQLVSHSSCVWHYEGLSGGKYYVIARYRCTAFQH